MPHVFEPWCIVGGELYECLWALILIIRESDLYQFFSVFQARNSYSNEVVAIKKMSYNGKQTTEVRNTHTQQQEHNVNQHTPTQCLRVNTPPQLLNGSHFVSRLKSRKHLSHKFRHKSREARNNVGIISHCQLQKMRTNMWLPAAKTTGKVSGWRQKCISEGVLSSVITAELEPTSLWFSKLSFYKPVNGGSVWGGQFAASFTFGHHSYKQNKTKNIPVRIAAV